MTKVKVMTVVFLAALALGSCEERPKNVGTQLTNTTNTTDSSKPPDKTTAFLERSDESPSLMSRIASWWPFGTSDNDSNSSNTKHSDIGDDNLVAEGHHSPNAVQRIGSGGGYPDRPRCNPCNKEPWIPVARNYGHETIIGFLQPSGHGGQNLPQQYGPPSQQYGPPGNINDEYGPPPALNFQHASHHDSPPSSEIHSGPGPNYGPPPSSGPSNNYGPPLSSSPSNNYGPPPLSGPGPNHGPLLSSGSGPNYGPPQISGPGPNYGPPPSSGPGPNYGPPGPPVSSGPGPIYGPPKPQYGPPKQQYGPPKPQYGPPKPQYGPPKQLPKLQYGPPKPVYGPPPKPQYGPPKPQYGPPKPIYGPPKSNYGPPQGKGNHGPPLNAYLSPPSTNFGPPKFKTKHGPPRNNHGPPDLYGPPSNKYGPPRPLISPPKNNYGPPPISQDYGGPQMDFHVQPSIEVYSGHIQSNNNAHITQQVGTDPEYLPPKEHQQLPLSNGPDDLINQPLPPIPLPNLSLAPLAPIYDPQPFRPEIDNSHFASQHHDISFDASPSIEIQQSVPVADYLASVDHPINVIQSPITDLNVAVSSIDQISDQIGSQHINQQDAYDYSGPTSVEDNSGQYSYNPNLRLSENPIVVDDYHAAAASTQNETVLNPQDSKKRGNDKDLGLVYFQQQNKVTPLIINRVLQQTIENYHPTEPSIIRDINDNYLRITNQKPTSFVSPTAGYSTWNPTKDYDTISSSSMIPPPKGPSTWFPTAATVKPIEVTKKPKQIQIIIPYTTNNQPSTYAKSSRDKLPVYTQPPNTESVWMEHSKDIFKTSNSQKVASFTQRSPSTTDVINIKELIHKPIQNINGHSYSNLPFDIIRLQKNIDGWTEQEYANTMKFAQKHAVTSRYVTAKKIPDAFFTTPPYEDNEVTTIKYSKPFFDHEPAGSSNKESKLINDEIENNFIITETPTTVSTEDYFDTTTDYPDTTTTTTRKDESWEDLEVSVSPITKEKIYVVTPQSSAVKGRLLKYKDNDIAANISYATDKFAVKINSAQKNLNSSEEEGDDVKVVLSEWPHIINNLETTTAGPLTSRPKGSKSSSPVGSSKVPPFGAVATATERLVASSTSRRHPLFGLIDLSAYTPPPNATIQTFSGHSKVVSSSSGTTKITSYPTTVTLKASTSTSKPTNKS